MCAPPATSGPPSARRACAPNPIGWSSKPVLGPAKPDPWDETAVKTNLTRLRGWAPVGQRLYGSAPFGKWRTQTPDQVRGRLFIAGLTSDELIAPWVIEGAMNQAAFETYVETQLVPLLSPGTVVILDNLSTHKSPRAAEVLKEAKSWFLFLPPYSPDLNPIEQAFSKLKAHLRRIGARTYDDLITAIGDVCALFAPAECWNFFNAAGYAVSLRREPSYEGDWVHVRT